MQKKPRKPFLTQAQFRALANFRYELRQFLRYGEELTRRSGFTPLQYQLLLQIKGLPEGESATIGRLAERLQAKHHGVVALVNRCEKLGLLKRHASAQDRRVVYLTLSEKGDRAVAILARAHRDELLSLKGMFLAPLLDSQNS